jgi:hypothetical protein
MVTISDQSPREQAYASAALDAAYKAIKEAPRGLQEKTRHRECYSIGGLVAAGLIAKSEALSRLCQAALEMPSYGERWRQSDLRAKVAASLERGMGSPRKLEDSREGPQRPQRSRPAPRPPQAVLKARSGASTTTQALKLWNEARDPRGTRAEIYLRHWRKLDLPADLAGEVLRWHPGAGAMLALFRNIMTGEPQAVSRIFLDTHARRPERKFLGPVGGAAVMLDPFDEVLEGLHVGEGLETCMAGRQLHLCPIWALGSAGEIERLPVLDGVECLTILEENDDVANARAIEICGTRWREAGREVLIVEPTFGKDLNDTIIGKEKAAHPAKESGLT